MKKRSLTAHGPALSAVAVAALLCAVAWFALINLGLYGRTKVIHTANQAVHTMEKARVKASRTLHRVQGDRGAYLEGEGADKK